MTRSDRIARKIIARDQEKHEAIYQLWIDLYGNKIKGINFPDKITNSYWCMHHLAGKETILETYKGITTELLKKVKSKIAEDKDVNNLLHHKFDFLKDSEVELKNFFEELSKIIYIPIQYHRSVFDKLKNRGQNLSISKAYKIFKKIKGLKEIEDFSNVRNAIKTIIEYSTLLEPEEQNKLTRKLETVYKEMNSEKD